MKTLTATILVDATYGSDHKVHPSGLHTIVLPDGAVQKVDPLEDSINGAIQLGIVQHWLQRYGIERKYYSTVARSETITIDQALKKRKTILAAAPTVAWFATGEHNDNSTSWIMHNLKVRALTRNASGIVQEIIQRIKKDLGSEFEDTEINVHQFSSEEEMNEYIQNKEDETSGVDNTPFVNNQKPTLH